MTRPTPATYDDDFFAWTQAQADALRRMPRSAVDPEVDIDHVAEEIEDLGKRDLREVTSLLTRLIEHLIKLAADRTSRDRAHWAAEAIHFQASAVGSVSPSLRSLLDIDRIWRNGRRAAARYLAEAGVTLTILEGCPLSLDFMLDDAFDMDAALARMTSTPRST